MFKKYTPQKRTQRTAASVHVGKARASTFKTVAMQFLVGLVCVEGAALRVITFCPPVLAGLRVWMGLPGLESGGPDAERSWGSGFP